MLESPWSELVSGGPVAADEWQRWRALMPLAIRASRPPVGSVLEARALGAAVAGLLAQHPEQAPRVVTWLREQPPYSRRCVEEMLSSALAAGPPMAVLAGLLELFEARVRWPEVERWLDRRQVDWQPVLDRLREGSPTVRRSAIQLLSLCPGDLGFAREVLLAALRDSEPGVVGRAATLLVRDGPPSARVVQALEQALERPGLRAFARERLRAALEPTG